jgi:transcription initiation factor IIE alpha subunit
MDIEPPIYDEEIEEEMEDEEWLERARHEIVEFILRRYGMMRSQDIARILNWRVREVNQVLRTLESWGKVKRTRVGRVQAWCPIEEFWHNHMYY